MAFVSEFEFDLFVSYATVDNESSVASPLGWVLEFVLALETALKQRLGQPDDLEIYFDQRALHANQELRALLNAAERSACFLAISSPSYAKRGWTLKELDTFTAANGFDSRLFTVEILPLESRSEYPNTLRDRKRFPFFAQLSPGSDVNIPLGCQDKRFHDLIHDLAEQIRRQLLAMRTVSGFRDAAEYVSKAAKGCKHALLAQTTEDLEPEYNNVRRYLEQYGHVVLPTADYRQDAKGFKEQFRADLSKADLVVQLLSTSTGRRPPDVPNGYPHLQFELATEARARIVQWHAPTLNVDAVEDAKHRELLRGETVHVSGLESFKASLQKRLAVEEPADATSQGDQPLQTVFINADEPDLEYARRVREEFVRNGFMAATPTDQSQPDLLTEHLLDCDALVVIHRESSHLWTDRNLRFFNRLRAKREKPPKIIAVLLGPPADANEELGIGMPGLRVIGDPSDGQGASVHEVIEELRSGT